VNCPKALNPAAFKQAEVRSQSQSAINLIPCTVDNLYAPVGLTSSMIWGGTLVGRQVSTVQRAELEYLRSRGIETTPTRFKNSEDNRIHKLVLLPYKDGVIGTKL
jgi:hypothetical protein